CPRGIPASFYATLLAVGRLRRAKRPKTPGNIGIAWHGACSVGRRSNQGSVSMIRRRDFVIGAGAAAIAGPAVLRAQEVTTIKMGALKLIHSIAPYFYEK